MPRQPADIFGETPPPPTPEPTPEPTPKPKPKKAATPPGPIQLELRTGLAGQQTKITLTQRVYSYNIDQTADTLTITGNLRPTHDEPG